MCLPAGTRKRCRMPAGMWTISPTARGCDSPPVSAAPRYSPVVARLRRCARSQQRRFCRVLRGDRRRPDKASGSDGHRNRRAFRVRNGSERRSSSAWLRALRSWTESRERSSMGPPRTRLRSTEETGRGIVRAILSRSRGRMSAAALWEGLLVLITSCLPGQQVRPYSNKPNCGFTWSPCGAGPSHFQHRSTPKYPYPPEAGV